MKNEMTVAMLNAAIALHKRIEIGFDEEPSFDVPICFDGVYDPNKAAEKMGFSIDIIMAAMNAMNMPINEYESEQVFYAYGYGKKSIEKVYAEEYAAQAC